METIGIKGLAKRLVVEINTRGEIDTRGGYRRLIHDDIKKLGIFKEISQEIRWSEKEKEIKHNSFNYYY